MDEVTDGLMYWRIVGQMDQWMVGWIDGWIDDQIDV